MNWKIAPVAVAAGLLALGGCAAPRAVATAELGARPDRQCFWNHQVNSFASADNRIVNVRVGVRDVYQMEMFGPCHDVDWSQKIALVSRSGSICTGFDAEIVAESPLGPQRCQVKNIRKLTPAEIAALPKRARP